MAGPVIQRAPTPVDATIASPAYQNILATLSATPGGMRAKDVCLALGLDITPKHTEGARAELQRLVARGILTETEHHPRRGWAAPGPADLSGGADLAQPNRPHLPVLRPG
jgi:hypothetical protein